MRRIDIDFDTTTLDGVEQIVEGEGIPEQIEELPEGETLEVDTAEGEQLPPASDEEKESDPEDYILSTVTPFSMSIVDSMTDATQKIASLFFIAQSLSGKNYTLYTSYAVTDEFEKEAITELPFYVENNFTSFRVAADIVINSYPVYISDFDFAYDKEAEDNYKFNIRAKRLDRQGLQETVTFKMVSDVFCSLKYMDNYVFECDINNYELSKASISARESENPSEIIIADSIDRIVAMAAMKKDAETCAIEFVINDGKEKYTMLSTFNFGKKFNKKKFKGMTIDKINSVYLNEADQYLQIFSEFCRFNNIDKEYLIIKGKNKEGINKIFFIDGTIRMEFESMIGEY